MNHQFDVKIATEYGLVEALLMQNFQFWILRNKANGEMEREGRTWTFNSVRAGPSTTLRTGESAIRLSPQTGWRRGWPSSLPTPVSAGSGSAGRGLDPKVQPPLNRVRAVPRGMAGHRPIAG